MIVRVAERARYTTIDNTAIEDVRLSWRALGVLVYLLSRPDNWEANYRHLATLRGDGQDTLRKLLKELEDVGYISRHREKADRGRFQWVQVIYEKPQVAPCVADHGMEDQSMEDRAMVSQRAEDAPITKKEELSTEEPFQSNGQGPLFAADNGHRANGKVIDHSVADAILKEWWEERKAAGNPIGQKHVACRNVIRSMVAQEVKPSRVAWALRNSPVCSTAALELAIQRRIQDEAGPKRPPQPNPDAVWSDYSNAWVS